MEKIDAARKAEMLARLKKVGFIQFEAYLMKRSKCTMTEMARELGMSVPDFRAYHDDFLASLGASTLDPNA